MMTCCTFGSSEINLTYSEQQGFSHTMIEGLNPAFGIGRKKMTKKRYGCES